MLANNLTLDDEEAVQEEFKELQALAVSSPTYYADCISLDTFQRRLPNPDSQKFQRQNPSMSRLQVPYHFTGLHG